MEKPNSELWRGLTVPELVAAFDREGWISSGDEWEIRYLCAGNVERVALARLARKANERDFSGSEFLPFLRAIWEVHPVAFLIVGECVSPADVVSFHPANVQTRSPGRVGNL